MSTSSRHPHYDADERSSTSVSTVVLTLAGVVIVCAAIKMTASIIAPVLLAFFLMMIFRPLMAALERRRVPRAVTIPLSIVLVYGVIVFLGLCVYLAAIGALWTLFGLAILVNATGPMPVMSVAICAGIAMASLVAVSAS